ncbi:MAG: hypothetical protein Q9184_006490 [Pyrenodesmia sp. 2 TL-2023]
MGNSDSKLVFKQGIFKLSDPKAIPPDDTYWTSFWKLPESVEDVFSLFTPADIRRARDDSLPNVETLLTSLVSRLIELIRLPAFPDVDLAPSKEALNCIRVITRILPFLYEANHLESWEDKFFWLRRRKISNDGVKEKAEVLFDGSASGNIAEKQEEAEDDRVEYMKPLGEELIDTLVDLLFYTNFTIPRVERSKQKVTYAIWQSGVGCNTLMQSSKEMENNRSEILRLLLTLSSKSLYMPAHIVPVKGVKALTYITTCPDKQIVLSLLCSQLNTALRYNFSAWRLPYDHMLYQDSKQVHVSYCLQFLLVLLLYPIPEAHRDTSSKNYFRHFLGRLHRPQDFEFLVDDMLRTLNQPLHATSSYLPGTQKHVKWAPEMLMLFWEAIQCNKRFRTHIIESEHGAEFAVMVLYYALEYKNDAARQGVVRMCVFILQTLSTEPAFGKSLNRRFFGQESLPLEVRIPDLNGTYADFVIISIHTLMTTSKGKADATYPALLATINNLAPYLQHLNRQSSNKLIQLFALMSAPSFLLANESNYALLQALLEAINAIIEHQYETNSTFVSVLFKARKKFEALRTFTLESGQQDVERQRQQRKASTESHDELRSPTRSLRNGSFDNVRSPQSTRTPSLSNVPEEGGTFTIGDDEDTDEDDEREPLATPSHSSPSNHASQTPSRSSSIDEPLPTQLKGMSEKARGKMPASQSSFSRHSSSTSLNSHQATIMSPTIGFSPSAHWIESWLPTLPLHTILTLLDSHTPGSNSAPPDHLPPGIDPSPPRVHLFSWTPLSLGWYESLLWGFIFASEMVVQKGTVGIWNGTNIRLFRVEQTAATGPSLMKPMGAVDAVGSNLVQRIGRMGVRPEAAPARAPARGSVRDLAGLAYRFPARLNLLDYSKCRVFRDSILTIKSTLIRRTYEAATSDRWSLLRTGPPRAVLACDMRIFTLKRKQYSEAPHAFYHCGIDSALTTSTPAPPTPPPHHIVCWTPQPLLRPAVFSACRNIIITIPTASGRHDPSIPLKFSPDPAQRPDIRLPAGWGQGNRECNVALQFNREATLQYDRTTLNDVQAAAMAVARECVIRPPHLGGLAEVGWGQRMAVNVLNLNETPDGEGGNGTVATE